MIEVSFIMALCPRNGCVRSLHVTMPPLFPLTVRIRGAVPSKLFDLLPLGVPILFCGGGEGEEIVKENQLGLVSAPGDYERLSKNIQAMSTCRMRSIDS